MEGDVLIEPDGIGQTHHGCAVVAVLRVPHVARLAPQGVDPVAAEHIEDLLTAFAVRQLGEHGEGLLVDWARTFVDNKIIPQSDREPLRRKAIDAAYSIMRGKGSTSYGIASAVVDVITAWKARDSKPRPLSFVLHGEFGIHEMALSVPVSFDVDSAPRVQSFEFDKELLGKLQETADSMKKFYKEAAETA